MARHHTHSIAFKRQVVQEYLAGKPLHGLARRHDPSHTRIWVDKYEAGVFDEDAEAANPIQEIRGPDRRKQAVVAPFLAFPRRAYSRFNASRRVFPTLKDAAFEAATSTLSPVRGLRALRAGRDFVEKVPKPVIVTVSSSARASPMAENTASTAAAASAFDNEALPATCDAISVLFIGPPPGNNMKTNPATNARPFNHRIPNAETGAHSPPPSRARRLSIAARKSSSNSGSSQSCASRRQRSAMSRNTGSAIFAWNV